MELRHRGSATVDESSAKDDQCPIKEDCHRIVELVKTNKDKVFGFSLVGGLEMDAPIRICDIWPGGVADRQGDLKAGDQLLAVNGVSLEGEFHDTAVKLISVEQHSVELMLYDTSGDLEEVQNFLVLYSILLWFLILFVYE